MLSSSLRKSFLFCFILFSAVTNDASAEETDQSLSAAGAWLNVMTSPQMRGTAETWTNTNLDWSLQPNKILIRKMPTAYDLELEVNPPADNGNAVMLFQGLIRDLVIASQNNRSVLVKINPGTYRFDSLKPGVRDRTAAIDLQGLTRVKIMGSEPTNPPLFVFTNPYGEGILIRDCKQVEVSNLRLDYEYPASYGKVAYFGKSLGNGDVRSDDLLNAGNTTALGKPLDIIGAIFQYDRVEKTWFNGVSAHHVTFEGATKPTRKNRNTFYDSRLAVIPAGQDVAILHTRVGFAHAVHAKGRANQDITLRAIKIHSYPQMGVLLTEGKGFWLDGIVIKPAGEELVSGRADGLHIAGTQGDIIVENCTVSGQGDDGLNIHGFAYAIAGLTSSGGIKINGPAVPAVGDQLALLSVGNKPLYKADILSVSKLESNTYDVKLGWGNCNATCRTGLFAEPDYQPVQGRYRGTRIGLAYPINMSSSRYVIRNNDFSSSGGRGMILEAPNGIVDRNTINRVAGSGIAVIATNSYFLSGPGAVNLKISGTTITNSTYSQVLPTFPLEGAIAIMTPGAADAYPLLQSIEIRDSVVNRVGLAFASVLRGTNIRFVGNNARNFGLAKEPRFQSDLIVLRSTAGIIVRD